MLTGEQIRAAREAVSESQQAFGVRFGVDQSTVARWEAEGPPSRGAAKVAIEREISAINSASHNLSSRGEQEPAEAS